MTGKFPQMDSVLTPNPWTHTSHKAFDKETLLLCWCIQIWEANQIGQQCQVHFGTNTRVNTGIENRKIIFHCEWVILHWEGISFWSGRTICVLKLANGLFLDALCKIITFLVWQRIKVKKIFHSQERKHFKVRQRKVKTLRRGSFRLGQNDISAFLSRMTRLLPVYNFFHLQNKDLHTH